MKNYEHFYTPYLGMFTLHQHFVCCNGAKEHIRIEGLAQLHRESKSGVDLELLRIQTDLELLEMKNIEIYLVLTSLKRLR